MNLKSVLYLFLVLCLLISCTSHNDDVTSDPETPTQGENPDNPSEENGENTEDNGQFNGSWTIYNTDNSDLPDNNINDIEFDSKGDAWILTAREMMKFDGENWTIFNSDNSGLSDVGVKDLAIDEVDAKWITTWDGLLWYKDGEWIQYNTSNSNIPTDDLTSIAVDSEGYKWIGTEYDGLLRYRGGEWKIFNSQNSEITLNNIESIEIDNNEVIWATTGNELVKIVNGELSIHSYPEDSFSFIQRGIASKDDEIWIGAEYGLASFINDEWTYYNYFDDNNCLIDCQTTDLLFIEDNLWVGNWSECAEGGLLNFTDCNPILTENSELPADPIGALNIDIDGNFWIGTYYGGLAIWARE